MKKEIIPTSDGSHTVRVPELNVTYHSVHGAVQESMHVFIQTGLDYLLNSAVRPNPLRVFEMGFGTGLNAMLTAIKAADCHTNVHYTAVETSPLVAEEAGVLNYAGRLGHAALFAQLHESSWNEEVVLSDTFTLRKVQASLLEFTATDRFHLVYYDAFAPLVQPELWTSEVFAKIYAFMEPDGVLVTYCSKGDVRRALQAAGFTVKKMPGPPGKREMLRAEKLIR